jgi:hypothetical protein
MCIIFRESTTTSPPRGKPVSPDHMCGRFHPARIPDPHMRRRVYVTETGEYEDRD